jgi:hypothetical protein
MTTTTVSGIDDHILERVRALLAKAESSCFAEEADAFTAKAQALMARHSIEEAMVSGRSAGAADGPAGHEIDIPDPYAASKFQLLSQVAAANRCQAVYDPRARRATVVGFTSDRMATDALYTSLLVQGSTELGREGSVIDARGVNRTRSFRNAFWAGFAFRVGQRLAESARGAETDIVRERGDGVLPVLARRSEDVDVAVHQLFPRLRRMRTSVTNAAGFEAGDAAGKRAALRAHRQVRPSST